MPPDAPSIGPQNFQDFCSEVVSLMELTKSINKARWLQLADNTCHVHCTYPIDRELVHLYGKGLLEPSAAKRLVVEGWPATLDNAFARMTASDTGAIPASGPSRGAN